MQGTRSIRIVSWMFGFACQNKTYCNDLQANQAGDIEDIAPGNAEKEGNGVEDVADDEFDSEIVVSVETDVASPPSQQARNEVQ